MIHKIRNLLNYIILLFLQGTIGKYASWDIGARSCIPQCFTCTIILSYISLLSYLSIYSTTGSQLFLNAPDSRYFPSSSSCTQDTCAQVPRLFDHTYSSFRARLQLLWLQTCKIMSCYLFNLLCYYGSHFQLQLLISVCLVTRLLSL
jgi:hypothetical protein